MSNNKIFLVKSNHKKSINEIIKRILWFFTWKMFATWTPRLCNSWRIFLLRLFGANIGNQVLILGSVWIDMPWNFSIGNFSALGKRVWIYNFANVIIGENTVISQDSTLCTSSHDYTHPFMPLFSKPIIVGNQVWIAAGVFVHPGITIYDGAVIGAKSIVTKDVPEWMVCAGHPCKPLKKRIINEVSFKDI